MSLCFYCLADKEKQNESAKKVTDSNPCAECAKEIEKERICVIVASMPEGATSIADIERHGTYTWMSAQSFMLLMNGHIPELLINKYINDHYAFIGKTAFQKLMERLIDERKLQNM
jgi:hypothetical protein